MSFLMSVFSRRLNHHSDLIRTNFVFRFLERLLQKFSNDCTIMVACFSSRGRLVGSIPCGEFGEDFTIEAV